MPAFGLLASLEDTFVSHNLCGIYRVVFTITNTSGPDSSWSSGLEKGFQTHSQVHVVFESVEQSYLIDEDSC